MQTIINNPVDYINLLHDGFTVLFQNINHCNNENTRLEKENNDLKHNIAEEKILHQNAVVRFQEEEKLIQT